MANPLTGDFDAVLQVGGATINRLLASMHQNRGTDLDRPTFPHSVVMRIGDEQAVEGLHGSVWAQVSVPRVELIHEATDRFVLEVGVRVRYRPDPGSAALPEFINGTIRAVYRLWDVDPKCFGWRGIAAQYVWPRVERDSVSFTGTASDDAGLLEIHHGVDGDAAKALITRQLTALLNAQFGATPQEVSKGFRPDSMRSLNVGGRSAVTTPIVMGADPPLGRLESLERLILEGHDFAIAIGRDYILSQVQTALDEFTAGFRFYPRIITKIDTGIFGDVKVIDIAYEVVLTRGSVEWSPLLDRTAAVITLRIWGEARTGNSAYNIGFDGTQHVSLTFNTSSETVAASAFGSPAVNVSASGLFGFLLNALPGVKGKIESEIKSKIPNLVNQLGTHFELKNRVGELVSQLQRLDAQASAFFEDADFGPDGIVFYGRVALGSRRPPLTTFVRANEQDGYSAFQSWIPGGRIDRFEWSWDWVHGAGTPGSESTKDRFLLRRPRGGRRTKFGRTMDLRDPLPGLDGSGRVCLSVTGVQVDPYTGDLVPLETSLECSRFGFSVPLHANDGVRLFLREYEDAPVHRPGPPREMALVAVGGDSAGAAGANTLVVHARWDEQIAAALREGLAACRRDDAGLLVLLLFREGVLQSLDSNASNELRKFADELEAPLLVNEDVRGSWSTALGFQSDRDEPAWRLISPRGGVSWMHDGHASAEQLASALDRYLFPGNPPTAQHERPGLDIGTRVPPTALDPHFGGIADSACPPPPVGRGIGSLVVAFAQRDSAASEARLEQLRHEQPVGEDDGRLVVVVVDGVGREAEDASRSGDDDGFATIADPLGAIAHRFDIRHWPTTVRLNGRGIVTGVQVGVERNGPSPEESA